MESTRLFRCSKLVRGSSAAPNCRGSVCSTKVAKQGFAIRLRRSRVAVLIRHSKTAAYKRARSHEVRAILQQPSRGNQEAFEQAFQLRWVGEEQLDLPTEVEGYLDNPEPVTPEPLTSEPIPDEQLSLSHQLEGYLGGGIDRRETAMEIQTKEELVMRILQLEEKQIERDLQKDRLISTLQAQSEKRAKEEAFAQARSQQRISDLADQVASLQTERARSETAAAQEMERLELIGTAEKRKFSTRLKALAAEQAELTTQKNALQAVVRARTATLEEMREEMKEAQERNRVTYEELEKARAANAQLQRDKQSLELSEQSYKQSLLSTEQELSILHSEHAAALESHENALRSVKHAATEEMEKAKEVQMQVARERDAAEARGRVLDSEVNRLVEGLHSTQQALCEKEQLAEDQLSNINKLKAEVKAQQEALAEEAAARAAVEVHRDNLAASLALETSALSSLKKSLQAARSTWAKEKQHLEADRRVAQADVQKSLQENQALATELEAVKEAFQGELAAAREEVERSQRAAALARSEAEDSIATSAALQEAMNAEKAILSAHVSHIQLTALESVNGSVKDKEAVLNQTLGEIVKMQTILGQHKAVLGSMCGDSSDGTCMVMQDPVSMLRNMRESAARACDHMTELKRVLEASTAKAAQERVDETALAGVRQRMAETEEFQAMMKRKENLQSQVRDLRAALNHVNNILI